MNLRSGLVTAVLAFVLVSMCGITLAVANPIIETTCQSDSGGCKNDNQIPIPLPLGIGSIAGSGTYISGPFGQFSESGNFATSIAGFFNFSSSSPSYCAFDDLDCSINIDVTSTASGVGGHIDIETDNTLILLNLGGLTFFANDYGSDSSLQGCGSFANCAISGVLVSSVPEPSSLSTLLIAFGTLRGVVFLRRKNMLAGRANLR